MESDTPAPSWFKSRASSGNAACVEVAEVAAGRLVRDSKLGDASPVLSVPAAEFAALLTDIQAGRLG